MCSALHKKSLHRNRNRNRNLLHQIIIQCSSAGLDVQKLFTPLSTITSLDQPSPYIQDFIGCFPFHVIPVFTYLSLCTSYGHHLIEPVNSLSLGNTQQSLYSHKGSRTHVNVTQAGDYTAQLLVSFITLVLVFQREAIEQGQIFLMTLQFPEHGCPDVFPEDPLPWAGRSPHAFSITASLL